MSKGIYLTRYTVEDAEYELWEGEPQKNTFGVYCSSKKAELLLGLCAEPFERITGFHLEPGQILRIPRKRFQELFRGLEK